MVKNLKIDFSKVKKGGQFSKRRMPEGDYRARITKVVDAESSQDGEDMWLFTIELTEHARATYPYYCKLTKDQFWKVRNIIESTGTVVPAKLVNVNPEKIVGKELGVSLQNDEYDGREQSTISALFGLDEMPSGGKKRKKARDDDEDEEEEEEETESEDEEEEEESDSDDEGEEEEEEEDDEEAKKKAKRERAKQRREARKKKAAKKKPADDEEEEGEDEMEELEIEDL